MALAWLPARPAEAEQPAQHPANRIVIEAGGNSPPLSFNYERTVVGPLFARLSMGLFPSPIFGLLTGAGQLGVQVGPAEYSFVAAVGGGVLVPLGWHGDGASGKELPYLTGTVGVRFRNPPSPRVWSVAFTPIVALSDGTPSLVPMCGVGTGWAF